MARYKPRDPHAALLLPVSLAAQIHPGTFEYAVNWIVDHDIDLSVFDARYCNDDTGASAYHPGILLKVVLLGYSRGLTSSRTIAQACEENVLFMALAGDVRPHFTTIAAFIRQMPDQILPVFRDVLLVCDEEGLIGKALFAVDGCKLPSNASREWSGTPKELERKVERMEAAVAGLLLRHRVEDELPQPPPPDRRTREKKHIETLSQRSRKLREALASLPERKGAKGQDKVNLTDPDSATMRTSHGTVQGYTGVAVVDDKSQVVVNAEALGTGTENALLPPVLDHTREHFSAIGADDPLASSVVTADSGYHSEATLKALKDAGVTALVADVGMRARDPRFSDAQRHKPSKPKPKARLFVPHDFHHDPLANTCVCPAGQSLKCSTRRAVIKGYAGPVFEGTPEQCGACSLRKQCLRKPKTTPYRQVAFLTKIQDTHPYTAAMRKHIDHPDGRSIYGRRMAVVEPVFGNLHNHRLRRFTLRGRDKVNAQWTLFCLVHNLQKLQPRIVQRQHNAAPKRQQEGR